MRCHFPQEVAVQSGDLAQVALPQYGEELVFDVLVDQMFPDDDGCEVWIGLSDADRDHAALEAYADALLEFDD